jgi:hypothetical protein
MLIPEFDNLLEADQAAQKKVAILSERTKSTLGTTILKARDFYPLHFRFTRTLCISSAFSSLDRLLQEKI